MILWTITNADFMVEAKVTLQTNVKLLLYVPPYFNKNAIQVYIEPIKEHDAAFID
jgi:hypothetical protein